MTQERQTKYTRAAAMYLRAVGHATNAEIISHLHLGHPKLSATTVHRLTTRMVQRGELVHAPSSRDNAVRFDVKVVPHDHFECLSCGCLRDVLLPQELLDSLQTIVGDCRLEGRLNIQGTCAKCLEKEEK